MEQRSTVLKGCIHSAMKKDDSVSRSIQGFNSNEVRGDEEPCHSRSRKADELQRSNEFRSRHDDCRFLPVRAHSEEPQPPNGLELSGPAKAPSSEIAELAGSATASG